jgi:lipopolysaccharide transport system permease protein
MSQVDRASDSAGVTTVISAARPAVWSFLSPVQLVRGLLAHRYLIREFTVREIVGRYKGARLGLLWSMVNPLLMLAVYTFVFSVVFKAKWGLTGGDSRIEFALTMFCGMVVYQVFAECAGRAPGLIVSNTSFVKRTVFPLEILPIAVLGAALFHAAVSLLILIVGAGIAIHSTSLTLICLPIVLLPVALLGLGFGWLLASLGVFIRDVGQVIGVLLQVLFFMTPIFYPLSAVPPRFRWVLRINPLTEVVTNARRAVLWGTWPDWAALGVVTVVAAAIAQLGYAWFMKTKRGFADVL